MTAIDAQGTSPFAEQARTLVFKTTLKYYIATSLGVIFTVPIYWSMTCVRSSLKLMQQVYMAWVSPPSSRILGVPEATGS